MSDVTRMLGRIEAGDPRAAERLAGMLYEELYAIACREMARERPGHTLQPTALVHEAYLRLVPRSAESFESRAHFLGAAAHAIRRVLVDHARARARLKRGDAVVHVDVHAANPAEPVRDEWLIAVDDALTELAEASPDTARVVDMRFFAGMTIPEVARALGVSESTVERKWRMARAWLRNEIDEHHDGP